MITPQAVNEMLAAEWPTATCRCIEIGPAHAIARLTPDPSDLRPGGIIAGPTLFSAADAALWFLAFGATGSIRPLALTSELSIRFVRPAKGDVVHARADLDRAGRRSVVGTVRVWTDENEDSPSAVAQGTYLLPRLSGREDVLAE